MVKELRKSFNTASSSNNWRESWELSLFWRQRGWTLLSAPTESSQANLKESVKRKEVESFSYPPTFSSVFHHLPSLGRYPRRNRTSLCFPWSRRSRRSPPCHRCRWTTLPRPSAWPESEQSSYKRLNSDPRWKALCSWSWSRSGRSRTLGWSGRSRLPRSRTPLCLVLCAKLPATTKELQMPRLLFSSPHCFGQR